MTIAAIVSLTVAFVILFSLVLIYREIAQAYPESTMSELYCFRLYRRTPGPRGPIISELVLERDCVDPFQERLSLSQEYPGWGVCLANSATDREYNALYGPYGLFRDREDFRPDIDS